MQGQIETDLERWYDANKMPASQRKVLSAAIVLFSEQGYERTSTMAIARKAGVSQAVLFKYFHSKRDLLHQIIDPIVDNLIPTYVAEFFDNIQHISFVKGHLRTTLREIAHERFYFLYNSKEVVLILLSEFITHEALKQSVLKAVSGQQDRVIRKVWREFRPGPALQNADAFRNFVQLLVTQLVGYFLLVTNISPGHHYDFDADLDRIADNVYLVVTGDDDG
ncbi:TetR/AcrR family transcriptional regulator [Lapidilactobacillus achengensis]|uniref:TetR/AcrR family transcriptional regulator n=1 Tax=Lapidilactobacillus achengensis TaxID=2486000 RepID=A0ABW1UMV0_9LACO|nr:helix-turn-helix domain-containing protein [Lapidilactobacillus achengensis]